MRCDCCGAILTSYEATMRHGDTGAFLDTFTDCLSVILEDVSFVISDNRELLFKDNTLDSDEHGVHTEWD